MKNNCNLVHIEIVTVIAACKLKCFSLNKLEKTHPDEKEGQDEDGDDNEIKSWCYKKSKETPVAITFNYDQVARSEVKKICVSCLPSSKYKWQLVYSFTAND